MDHVAGVYIEEHRVTCIIGEPNISDLTKVSPFDRQSIEPRTFNRPGSKRRQTIFTRKTSDPLKILGRAAAWLVENSDDLKFVSVACFGPFVSLRGRPSTPTENSDYGRLTSVPNYKNWGGINLHYAFSNALQKAGKKAEVRVYIDADAAAVGEYWLHARRFRGTDLRTRFLRESYARKLVMGFFRRRFELA